MLAITANWGIGDGSLVDSRAGRAAVWLDAIRRAVVRAGWGRDGRYRPVDHVTLVFAGDTFDWLLSERWAGKDRPWHGGARAEEARAQVFEATVRAARPLLRTVAGWARRGLPVAAATPRGRPAKHLNSGFLHEGRVYCAHSNYPAEPPESEVRLFDPATGKLTLFHRFEDPPGSLVWCVRRGGNWWCCFAWYRGDNARTLLVEYAYGGLEREVRRFTFPPAVVADWDGMSASGGIWDGDTLLVSHHHFPILYRLALPAAGRELRLVEALGCPFPGQGIAADPAGGLVGIDRPHRRIVFAERE